MSTLHASSGRKCMSTFEISLRSRGWVQAPDGSWFRPKTNQAPSPPPSRPFFDIQSENDQTHTNAAGRIRRQQCPRDKRTKTERLYESQVLQPLLKEGVISSFCFEPCIFILAPGRTYRPDYMVTLPDGTVEWHEVKGPFCREDGLVKWSWASKTFTVWRWRLIRYGGRTSPFWFEARDSALRGSPQGCLAHPCLDHVFARSPALAPQTVSV